MRCLLALVLLLGSPALLNSQQSKQEIVKSADNGPDQPVVLEPSQSHQASDALTENLTASVGIVSVEDLKIPDKARKEFALSERAFRSGDRNGAVKHMKNALGSAPGWPQAHAALAVAYKATNQYDKSIQESQKALDLNPRYRDAMEILAGVLCLEKRYAEAEPVARRALALDPGAASSQFLLGGILVKEAHYSAEAITLLEQGKREYPRALILLAGAEIERGEVSKAKESLREYLPLPNSQDQALAKGLLERLDAVAQNEK